MKFAVRMMSLGLLCLAPVLFVRESLGAIYVLSNSNSIAINDSNSPPAIATPYPSTITVAGLTGQVITDVKVTLHGLSHQFPSDIYVLLAGPQGQITILMAAVGGSVPIPVTNITLTLDDTANPLPIQDPLFTGTFRPTARHPILNFDFPAPAPGGSSNAVASLSVFDNTDPTGSWRLFVVDNVDGDTGELAGGWTLNLTVKVPLTIIRSQSNVVISWPASAPGLTLQFSPGFVNPNTWTNVPTAPTLSSGKWVVTNSIAGANKYYRLIGP